jgi:hypothetical protein
MYVFETTYIHTRMYICTYPPTLLSDTRLLFSFRFRNETKNKSVEGPSYMLMYAKFSFFQSVKLYPGGIRSHDPRTLISPVEDITIRPRRQGMFPVWCESEIPVANPTIVIYNASVVNFYNATGSLARFKNKNILFYFVKRSSLLQRWRCSCKFKNRRIGSCWKFDETKIKTKAWLVDLSFIFRVLRWFTLIVTQISSTNKGMSRFCNYVFSPFSRWYLITMYRNSAFRTTKIPIQRQTTRDIKKWSNYVLTSFFYFPNSHKGTNSEWILMFCLQRRITINPHDRF